jgi:hypothetical protein
MIQSLSFISAHFYDFDWIEMLISKINLFTPVNLIEEILVINQDRTLSSYNKLHQLDPKIKVLEYPKSDTHFNLMGHDHAAVLNKAVIEAKGQYICIFDSDAHPINELWLNKCEIILTKFDAILALDPLKIISTHPCFMLIKRDHIDPSIKFDEGLFDNKIDTGRLVGQQLINAGRQVFFASANRAFNNYWGFIYLNSIYHHKSASYLGADERLTSQIDWKNAYFKNLIKKRQKYEFTTYDFLIYKLINRFYKIFN